MAEAILKKLFNEDSELRGHFSSSSAGVAAFDGDPASANAAEVLKNEWGIDLQTHSARSLSRELAENAYLILTMTRAHKERICLMWPDMASRTYTLKEYVLDEKDRRTSYEYNYALDIPDPYGMSREVYRRCAMEIHGVLEKLIAKIKRNGR